MRFIQVHISIVVFILLVLTACASVNTDQAYMVDGKNLIDLFDEARAKKGMKEGIGVPDAEAFIKTCCISAEKAVFLLKKNGFEPFYRDIKNKRIVTKIETENGDFAIKGKSIITSSIIKNKILFSDTYFIELEVDGGLIVKAVGIVQDTYPAL